MPVIRNFKFPDLLDYREFQISGFSCLSGISNFRIFLFIQNFKFPEFQVFPYFWVYPEFQVNPDFQVNTDFQVNSKPQIERVSGLKAKSVGPSGLFRPKPVSPVFRLNIPDFLLKKEKK